MKNRISLLFLVSFLILLGVSCQNQSHSRLVENNKAIALLFAQVWSSHDSVKFSTLFAKDFIYRDMPFGLESKTKNQIINFVNITVKAVTDLKMTPISIIASDSMAVVEWIWTGTYIGGWGPEYPGNNKPFTIRGVSIMEIENGLIKRNYDYYDKDPFRKKDELK